jgi:hypothetical protein
MGLPSISRFLRRPIPPSANSLHLTTTETADDKELQIRLAEYGALREEVLRRIDNRLTVFLTSLTASAAIIGVALQLNSALLILVVPIINSLYGLIFIYHVAAVSEIGLYIANNIERALNDKYGAVLGWHISRTLAARRVRRWLGIGYIPLALATLLPPVLGLSLAWSMEGATGLKISLFFLGVVSTSYYASQYYIHVIKRQA